jgi:hypothetical protein
MGCWGYSCIHGGILRLVRWRRVYQATDKMPGVCTLVHYDNLSVLVLLPRSLILGRNRTRTTELHWRGSENAITKKGWTQRWIWGFIFFHSRFNTFWVLGPSFGICLRVGFRDMLIRNCSWQLTVLIGIPAAAPRGADMLSNPPIDFSPRRVP